MEKIWENLAYVGLGLCIIANIAVGYLYIFAQSLYLISNSICVARDFKLQRPIADKVRDISFLAITIALIIIRIIL